MKYRKKPILVDAVQWNNVGDEPTECKITYRSVDNGHYWCISTLEGDLRLVPGCWIVGPGARGEYWPVQADIFETTYEKVE